MSVNESWPYVTERHKTESEEHIRMKNLAIEWLLGLGFDVADIEVEKRVETSRTYGYTDVYAGTDAFEVFVECERGAPLRGNLSSGGAIPAKKGKLVYFLNQDSLYRVKYETVEVELGHNYVVPTAVPREGMIKTKTFKFARLGPIPSKDERYKYSPEAQRRERQKVDWL